MHLETVSHLTTASPPSFADHLRTHSLRLTAPRRAVLQVFERHPHRHLVADEVLAAARRHHPGLGRATVYRTLDLLARIGMLRTLPAAEGRTGFACVVGGHQHAVCQSCRRVVELDSRWFRTLAGAVARRTGFSIQSQLLEFIGLCKRCRKVSP